MYFDAAATNITQGTSSSFTLLHDVKKLSNDDFEEFDLLIALIFKTKNGRLVMKSKCTERRFKKSRFVK